MASKTLLLLEDDANLNETIAEYLRQQGYEIVPVYDGEEAQDLLYERSFDLLLLDVNTPGIDGFELLRDARERGVQTPAIFLTARESVEDLEEGFQSGCDDYIRKPFALKELRIRIETLLRRGYYHAGGEGVRIDAEKIYDPDAMSLRIGDREVRLGRKEARLLDLFLRHPGEVLSHETIFSHLWEYDEEPSDSSLRTYIKNLRKLIGKERIVSLKKQGYRYVAAE